MSTEIESEPASTEIALHARVKALVLAKGLSYGDVVEQTGWEYLRVVRLLTGKVKLTAEDMKILAAVVDEPIGVLYGEETAA